MIDMQTLIERDQRTTNLLRDLDAEIESIIDWGGDDPDHKVLALLKRSREAILTLHSDVVEYEIDD